MGSGDSLGGGYGSVDSHSHQFRGKSKSGGAGCPCCCCCCWLSSCFARACSSCASCLGFLVLLSSILVPVSLLLYLTAPRTLELDPRETRAVHPWPSAFAQGLHVTGTADVQVYLYDEPPRLSKVDSFQADIPMMIPVDDYQYIAYFLNEGSKIDLSLRVDWPWGVDVLLFEGDRAFNLWADNDDDVSWKLKKWAKPGKTLSQRVRVSSPGYYYLVFSNSGGHSDARIDVKLDVARTIYELEAEHLVCSADGSMNDCYVSLNGRQGWVILQAPDDDQADSYYVTVLATPGWPRFLVVNSVYICAAMVLSLVLCFCCGRQRARSAGGSDAKEQNEPLQPQYYATPGVGAPSNDPPPMAFATPFIPGEILVEPSAPPSSDTSSSKW